MPFLYEEIDSARKFGTKENIPPYISSNLNNKIELRDYQKTAIENFLINEKPNFLTNKRHLLWHMATGSGKTVIVASLIIYYYKQGYRNFLFFVNQTNIISKTKSNFIDSNANKYLFKEKIEIDGNYVPIREVKNFEQSDESSINIAFYTIQKLQSDLFVPAEDHISFEDLREKEIIMISDESHHLNSQTKKGKEIISDEDKSWELTVNRILLANEKNKLLEFTATCMLDDQGVKNKYLDKIIFNYPLKDFRVSGYTKEFYTHITTGKDKLWDRALKAIVLSKYRELLFQANNQNIKPIVLIRAPKINIQKKFYEDFFKNLNKLTTGDLEKILNIIDQTNFFENCKKYLHKNKISLSIFLKMIQSSFSEQKSVILNSKEKEISEEDYKLLNDLENLNNPIRLIFTVNMLNEGWDALNLFDIVSLQEDHGSIKGNTPDKTTISAAQLIGRGARYCPFKFNASQESIKRKYDSDFSNPNKICESLIYHSWDDEQNRYISVLRIAIREIGLMDEKTIVVNLKLKDSFKKSYVYKNGFIYLNKKIEKDRNSIHELPERLQNLSFEWTCEDNVSSKTYQIFDDSTQRQQITIRDKNIKLKQIPFNISNKAIRQFNALKFDQLHNLFPNLNSIKEFVTSDRYCGNITITFKYINNIVNDDMLKACKYAFNEVSISIQKEKIGYEGTKKFVAHKISELIFDKQINVSANNSTRSGFSQTNEIVDDFKYDLSDKDWYAFEDNFGTGEEKSLVKFFASSLEEFSKKYEDISLIRNEKHFALYSFSTGEKFEPDYLLFLKFKGQQIFFNIFIEPKGEHLIENDKWKEEFLESLKNQVSVETTINDSKYKIWGLCFFNRNIRVKQFRNEMEELLKTEFLNNLVKLILKVN